MMYSSKLWKLSIRSIVGDAASWKPIPHAVGWPAAASAVTGAVRAKSPTNRAAHFVIVYASLVRQVIKPTANGFVAIFEQVHYPAV
jgi:hypothetical protein